MTKFGSIQMLDNVHQFKNNTRRSLTRRNHIVIRCPQKYLSYIGYILNVLITGHLQMIFQEIHRCLKYDPYAFTIQRIIQVKMLYL